MNNKKLGATIIVFSLLLGAIAFQMITKYSRASNEMACVINPECQGITSILNYTHLVVGILFSLLSLGIYIFVFHSGSEEAILKRLEEEKNRKIDDEKFGLLSKTLDENERKVLSAIKEKEGITQNMVTLKTGLSKAKVSLVLSNFEKKNLIKREVKGKTYSIYLTA